MKAMRCVPDDAPKFVYGDVIKLFNNGGYDALCVTTNAISKRNGDLVMGAGVAKAVAKAYPEVPTILGSHVRKNGNVPYAIKVIGGYVISFPTKNDWRDDSDLDLIVDSMKALIAIMDERNLKSVLLPRPGCANGGLNWDDVYEAIKPYTDGRIHFVSLKDQPSTPPKSTSTKRVLECSTKGDARFSALCAEVMVCGKTQTIEDHYQLSKRFREGGRIVVPKHFKQAKGRKPVNFSIADEIFDVEELTSWYVYLWVKYLDENPNLVKVLEKYDDYSDMFKRNSINCQADVIRDYMKDRKALVTLHKDFFKKMRYLEQ